MHTGAARSCVTARHDAGGDGAWRMARGERKQRRCTCGSVTNSRRKRTKTCKTRRRARRTDLRGETQARVTVGGSAVHDDSQGHAQQRWLPGRANTHLPVSSRCALYRAAYSKNGLSKNDHAVAHPEHNRAR